MDGLISEPPLLTEVGASASTTPVIIKETNIVSNRFSQYVSTR